MIIIVGGGIFGLSIGWYLARQGYPITLIEKAQVGYGATRAAAGMLMPWKLSNSFSNELFVLQRESHRQWKNFANQLSDGLHEPLDYQTRGRFFVALTEKVTKRLRNQYEFHRESGVAVEWLAGAEARYRAPYLGPQVEAAVFSPLGHAVDSRQVVMALRRLFLRSGGVLREYTPVRKILVGAKGVIGVRLANGDLFGKTVILAAGAWTGRLEGLPEPLRQAAVPRKGQTLMLQMSGTSLTIDHTVIGPVYFVPRSDGRLVVGTTVERDAGFDHDVTVSGVFHILKKASRVVPDVGQLPVLEMSAGLRPTGPERQPVIGPTNIPGLIIATGGHSYGILLAPAVAQAVAELVQRNHISPLIAPFLPIRRLPG
jgi:glycine oxidase